MNGKYFLKQFRMFIKQTFFQLDILIRIHAGPPMDGTCFIFNTDIGNGPGMLTDFESVLTIGKVFVRYAQILLQGIGHGIQTAVTLSDKGFRLAVYLDVHGAGTGAVRFLL